MTTINWIIESLLVRKVEGSNTDVVITADWRCNGSQESFSGTCYGSCSFAPPTGSFTPYPDLTQDQVLGWCFANGVDQAAIEANVTQYGTGAINVDGCRIGTDTVRSSGTTGMDARRFAQGTRPQDYEARQEPSVHTGRWPANVCLDEDAAGMLGEPSRFFYTAKVSRKEREAGLDGMPEREGGIKNDSGRGFSEGDPYKKITTTNHHPTVKPIALMRWLCRLTPVDFCPR